MASMMHQAVARPPAAPRPEPARPPAGRRPRRRTLLSAGLVLVLLVALVAVAQRRRGLDALGNELTNGSAWLLARNGTVALVDGLSGRAVTRLPAANAPGDDLHVVQHGPDGFVVDRTTGTVMRVDGRTLRSGPPVSFSGPGPDPLLDVFVAGDGLAWVTSGSNDLVYPVDPTTLDQRGDNMALSTDAAGVVVVPDGTLFALDAPNRILDVFDPQRGAGRRVLDGVGPDASITVVGGAPVLVDPAQGRRYHVGADGSLGRSACFAVPSGMVSLGAPSARSTWLTAVGADRRLYAADTRRDECPTPIVLDADGQGRYGDPVEKDRLVFVPDFATGEIVIVDVGLERPSVTRSAGIIAGGAEFDLFVDDGLLWIDDRSGDVAGVLLADRSVRNVQKFDPAGTGGGAVGGTVPGSVAPGDVPDRAAPDAPDASPPRPPSPDTPEDPATPDTPDTPDLPDVNAAPDTPAPRPPTQPELPPRPEPGPEVEPPLTLQAGFEVPARVFESREATFVSTSTGSPTRFEWSVDGERKGGDSGVFRHTFPAGSAVVSLTVRTDDGRSSTVSHEISVIVVEPELVTVPTLVGLSRGVATQRLLDAGLNVGTVQTRDSARPKDEVLGQQPAGGQLAEQGTAVDLTVSAGGGPFALADMRNRRCDEAVTLLREAQLVVPAPTIFRLPAEAAASPVAATLVVTTVPRPGTTVSPGDTVRVDCKDMPPAPNLVGLLRSEAEAEVRRLLGDVPITLNTVTDTTRRQNEVVSHTPTAGTPVDLDTLSIALDLASGPVVETVVVPAICNGSTSQAQAESALSSAGLGRGNVGTEQSDTVPAGAVIRTSPACGQTVARGSLVDLLVSSGRVTFGLPDLRGRDEAAVTAELQRLGLRYTRGANVESGTYAAGTAAVTRPGPGSSVGAGDQVTVDFSTGPPVTVPDPSIDSLTCSPIDSVGARCSVSVLNGTVQSVTWSVGIELLTSGGGTRTESTTRSTTSIEVSGFGLYGSGPPDTTGATTLILVEQMPNRPTVTAQVTFVGGKTATRSVTFDWANCH
ncbi:MAG: PASTA domain-containing protein [Acidimicrobiia bacterium]